MKPINVWIAFGNKLQAIREQDGGLEGFDPEKDEEFQLLVAATQYCFTVLEDQGVVIPLAAFDLSMDKLADKIDSLVEKYQ